MNLKKVNEIKKEILSIKNLRTKHQINDKISKPQKYLIEMIDKTIF